jgi:hypothetical protein
VILIHQVKESIKIGLTSSYFLIPLDGGTLKRTFSNMKWQDYTDENICKYIYTTQDYKIIRSPQIEIIG